MAGSTVVVSLRSKGIPGCTPGAFFHWRTQMLSFINEISDLPAAVIITTVNLSWSALLSVLITLLVMIVNASTKSIDPDVVSFFPLFAYVVLPLLLLLYMVIQRRDRAQAGLSRFKVNYVAIKLQAAALSLPPTPATTYTSLQPQPRTHTQDAGAHLQDGAGLPSPHPPEVGQASQDLQAALLALQEDLHKYLAHNRPYARHFYVPYRPERIKSEALYKVSRQLGALSHKVQRSMRETIVCVGCLRDALSQPSLTSTTSIAHWPSQQQQHTSSSYPAAPSPRPPPGYPPPANHHLAAAAATGPPSSPPQLQPPQGVGAWWSPPGHQHSSVCLLLGQQVAALHQSVEDLMSVKEQHTPVLLRAVVRWFTTVIIPVLLGWYWLVPVRGVAAGTGIIMAVLCQIALMVVVDTVTSLEDPFDPVALDAVSCLEMLDGARMMSGLSDDADLADEADEQEQTGSQGGGRGGKLGPTQQVAGQGGGASSPRREGVWVYGDVPDQQLSMPPMPPLPVPQSSAYSTGNTLMGVPNLEGAKV